MHKGLPTTGSEKNNVIRLRGTALHPRRSNGHTGDGQSGGGRPFFQKASHGNCRYVSLQDISVDLGSVASREIHRHFKPFPDDLKVSGRLDRNGKPCSLEMLYPTCTAPTIRILVNQNVGSLGEGRSLRHDQRRAH